MSSLAHFRSSCRSSRSCRACTLWSIARMISVSQPSSSAAMRAALRSMLAVAVLAAAREADDLLGHVSSSILCAAGPEARGATRSLVLPVLLRRLHHGPEVSSLASSAPRPTSRMKPPLPFTRPMSVRQ